MPKLPKIPNPPTPRQPKAWDSPPRPDEGDAGEEAVWAAVGRALSKWEDLEHRLSMIFGILVAPDADALPAQRAYGSVLTFRGRKEMIDAAAGAVFFSKPDPDLAKALLSLMKEIGNFAARRNEVAHGSVATYFGPVGTKGGMPPALLRRPDKATFVLRPPEYATNKTALEPGRFLMEQAYHAPIYAYSSVEIGVFERHFVRLTQEAHDLYIRLYRHQRTPDKP